MQKIKTNEMMLYRNMIYQELFDDFGWLIEHVDDEYYNDEDKISLLYESVNSLIEVSENYGLEGNLFHSFLAFMIAYNENAFSTSCEFQSAREGSINHIAIHDLIIFKKLMEYDLTILDKTLDTDAIAMIVEYSNGGRTGKVFNKRIRDRILGLTRELEGSKDVSDYFKYVTDFYRHYGVGKFGLNKAFRLTGDDDNEFEITPITSIQHIQLEDLVGYELQKKQLIDNTEAFINGKKANNVLLFGDSGTGKSSSIKAILNKYFDQGLRMIEVYKHQFGALSELIERIKDRHYKFIIYMDDLSFEEFEIEYKYLKAIIEGGLAKKPDNVLIYATSNRRHLVKEKFSDNTGSDGDLHVNDTVQEKLSLFARFGLSIYYGSPDMKEFKNIVKRLAERNNVEIDEEKLYIEATKWEMRMGGLSGRTAEQFINHLLGSDVAF
jgi:predicted AAA+ superfamily ATPase